jgi:hypothetical protein
VPSQSKEAAMSGMIVWLFGLPIAAVVIPFLYAVI